MQVIGRDHGAADRLAAHPPAPGQLKDHQRRHHPVKQDTHGGVAAFVMMPGRPFQQLGEEPFDHAARASTSDPNSPARRQRAANRYRAAAGAHMIRPAACWSSSGVKPQARVV